MLTASLHERNCKHCGHPFMQQRPLQYVCSKICAARKVRADKKAEKAMTRKRKDALKTIADRIAEAQTAFNAFVRARDKDKGCISCGKPFPPQRPGGSYDAGHFISRGHATHLRFDEDNCFGQCKGCNRPGGATRAEITAGVVARIGPERLAAVEGNYDVHKWTHPELIAIKNAYRAKLKELKA